MTLYPACVHPVRAPVAVPNPILPHGVEHSTPLRGNADARTILRRRRQAGGTQSALPSPLQSPRRRAASRRDRGVCLRAEMHTRQQGRRDGRRGKYPAPAAARRGDHLSPVPSTAQLSYLCLQRRVESSSRDCDRVPKGTDCTLRVQSQHSQSHARPTDQNGRFSSRDGRLRSASPFTLSPFTTLHSEPSSSSANYFSVL